MSAWGTAAIATPGPKQRAGLHGHFRASAFTIASYRAISSASWSQLSAMEIRAVARSIEISAVLS